MLPGSSPSIATRDIIGKLKHPTARFRDTRIATRVLDIPFHSSSIAKSESIRGVKSGRLVVISGRAVVIAFVRVSVASGHKGERAFRIDSDRLSLKSAMARS
jgi:hypothetical protein